MNWFSIFTTEKSMVTKYLGVFDTKKDAIHVASGYNKVKWNAFVVFDEEQLRMFVDDVDVELCKVEDGYCGSADLPL